jgi:hypothetical protein
MDKTIDFDELRRIKEKSDKDNKAKRKLDIERYYEEQRLKTEAFINSLPEKAAEQAEKGYDFLDIWSKRDIGFCILGDEAWNMLASECKRLFPHVKLRRHLCCEDTCSLNDNITCHFFKEEPKPIEPKKSIWRKLYEKFKN